MLRLPLMITGLGAAAAIVAATTGALGDVNQALAGAFGDPGNKGPLIIQVTRSSSLSQGASEVLKATRCLLEWQGGIKGQFQKHCTTTDLDR